MGEVVFVEQDSVPQSKISSPISNKKDENNVALVNYTENVQTVAADIWTDEQINFLNQVDKILVFHVRITDIGSRKLELYSEMGQTDIENFIKLLLHPSSYTEAALITSKKDKDFEPGYQMLLEVGDEKLTLMFDVKGFEMVVANLFDRKHYRITSALVDVVLKI